MYGVNGNPWFGLDKFLDIDSLVALQPDFARALALSNQFRSAGTVGGQVNLLDQSKRDLTDEVQTQAKDPNYQYKGFLKGLTTDQVIMFFKYMYKVVSLGEVIPLRRLTGTYYQKHLSTSAVNGPAYNNFDFFHKWLSAQNIFEEVGRVLVFINEPGVVSTPHRDYGDSRSRRDPFIWLSIGDRKRFWVYDDKTNTKHYITEQVVTFDNADWHGSDPSEYVGWSIRVDGVFKKEFLDKTGLDLWIDYNAQHKAMQPKTS